MPFSFKPTTSQTENGPAKSSFSFGDGQDLMSRDSEKGASLLDIVIYFICGTSIVIAGILYGYKSYLESQIAEANLLIEAEQDKLAKYPIEEMRKLSARIKAVNDLTKEHPYVNAAFRILEDSIENEITYQTFGLNFAEGKYTVTVQATSPDYKSIAQQVDTLRNDPYRVYISDVKVSSLSPTKDGKVSFSLGLPMSITGTLPEDLNFSYGRASSTPQSLPVETAGTAVVSTSTPVSGSSTPPAVTR